MFDGYEYSIKKINNLFDRNNVFIKINYIDPNEFTKSLGLKDMDMDAVKRFTDNLSRRRFDWEFRYEHTKGKRLEVIE